MVKITVSAMTRLKCTKIYTYDAIQETCTGGGGWRSRSADYHYYDGQRWGGIGVTFQSGCGSIQWHLVLSRTHVTAVCPAHWAKEQDHTGWTTHSPLLSQSSLIPCNSTGFTWVEVPCLFLPTWAQLSALITQFNPASPWSSQWCCALFRPSRKTDVPCQPHCSASPSPPASLFPLLLCRLSLCSLHCSAPVSSS